jgi:propionate CoA-transferase
MPLSVRKVIARRAAMELHDGDVINLGFGMPDGVASVLAEEGREQEVVFTVEQGHIGGVPVGGSDFGMCVNPDATVDAGYQFDWYDGGGLDVAVLSFAELDARGSVNVGRFAGRIAGVGGFVNISQGARRLVFVGTFVAGGAYEVGGDRPLTVPGGGLPKVVESVGQVSFSGPLAVAQGKPVLYVTERAVFRLTSEGLELTEIAPGLDLDADVLAHMPFTPRIGEDLREMDPRLFRAEPMGLTLHASHGGASA